MFRGRIALALGKVRVVETSGRNTDPRCSSELDCVRHLGYEARRVPGDSMKMRTDIQALRGLAVALVVLDHFEIGPFENGFLGVDLFFVISGFLITGIIARDIAEGSFSFAGFYARRARRILPAAYATIALTSLGGIWFLNDLELEALTSQVLGAVTYTINFVLWSEVGYFDLAADYKPLLHLWSLAVEEQFYVAFPALLAFTPKRWRPRMLSMLGAASLVGCFWLASVAPTAAFYLLPTRAWELMIGALGALMVLKGTRLEPAWLSWPALAAIIAVAIRGAGAPHPGVDALIVTVATLAVILAGNRALSETMLARAAAWLGDISYSLYLVHWPIFVFLKSSYVEEIPQGTLVAAAALSVALASLMYVTVEQPMRRSRLHGRHLAAAVAGVGAAVVLVQTGAERLGTSAIDFSEIRQPNYGLNRICASGFSVDRTECRTSDGPHTLIWGDSYAMYVASGARYHLPQGIVQATLSACPPFLGYVLLSPRWERPEQRVRSCMDFNDRVVAWLASSDIRTVILAASFQAHATEGNFAMHRNADGTLAKIGTSLAVGQAELQKVVATLRSLGKQVIVISPAPPIGAENLICSERLLTGKPILGGNKRCEFSADRFRRFSEPIGQLLAAAVPDGATILDLSEATCDESACQSVIDGVPMYRDAGHLSYAGARKAFEILQERRLLPSPFS